MKGAKTYRKMCDNDRTGYSSGLCSTSLWLHQPKASSVATVDLLYQVTIEILFSHGEGLLLLPSEGSEDFFWPYPLLNHVNEFFLDCFSLKHIPSEVTVVST